MIFWHAKFNLSVKINWTQDLYSDKIIKLYHIFKRGGAYHFEKNDY